MTNLGKSLVILGALIALAGVIILLAGRIPYLGRLPGDFSWRKGNFRFYFPLATSLLLSAVLTLLLYLVTRFLGRR